MSKITTLSPEELEVIGKSPTQIVREKLEKIGDADAMAEFEKYALARSQSDINVRSWLTRTMSVLYRRAGAEALEESLLAHFEPNYANAADYWEMNFHDRVLYTINGIREFLDSSVEVIDEDDEKLRFTMTPCMSGQRLREIGMYDEPDNCAKCSAHAITGGRDNFPIYCTHNPIMDIACINVCGYPNSVTEYPEDMCSCSCTYVIYKRKEDIPEEYFTRIGKQKPKADSLTAH